MFFNLFRRQWMKLTGLALAATISAAAIALLAGKLLNVTLRQLESSSSLRESARARAVASSTPS